MKTKLELIPEDMCHIIRKITKREHTALKEIISQTD